MKNDNLELDLSGLDIQEVEVFMQEGSRGTAEFAASTGSTGSTGTNSCTIKPNSNGL